MLLSPTNTVSPLDGRYFHIVSSLLPYASEHALNKYRVFVEVEYLIWFSELTNTKTPWVQMNKDKIKKDLIEDFSEKDTLTIKKFEEITRHDVKAVEYFIKNTLDQLGLSEICELVHFGLTSMDINNTAIPLMVKDSLEKVMFPTIKNVIDTIHEKAKTWKSTVMLAYTHGQPAITTTLGKELMVFVERLQSQFSRLRNIPHTGKFGGAVGTLSALKIAFPQIDWISATNKFVEMLGLQRQQFTTQIEHYDDLCEKFDALKRVNMILLDLVMDVWTYISKGYFKLAVIEGEVGSSAMPQKVNPIDFENAEGNLGLSNALLEFFPRKLAVSRLQRDLSDSSVLRNIWTAFGHSLIALNSILKGFSKVSVNEARMREDLYADWSILSEAIQTILRRENFPKPYEVLKSHTRGNCLTREELHRVINSICSENSLNDRVRSELLSLTPETIIGQLPSFD